MTFKYKNFMRHLMFAFGIMFITSLNSQTNDKQNFISAKIEIEQMLNGQKPLDYERAVFITENAYYGNELKYEDFVDFIDLSTNYITYLSATTTRIKNANKKRNILISQDSVSINLYRACTNYAIFRFMTDTTFIRIGRNIFGHYPYSYSYQDPLASNDWKNSQVTSLYLTEKKQGNCNSLTSLFMILSLRLGSNANLCTTQGHIFLSHADENGISYNIELASKAFPGTGSIETITHTSDKIVKNGFAMRKLNLKQSIGLCLLNLAKGYQHKFNSKDEFMLECAELCLKYDSLNLNAMLLKADVLEDKLVKIGLEFNTLKRKAEFLKYQEYIKFLYEIGYREMSIKMKNQIIAIISKDSDYKILNENNTYNPFSHINKNYDRIITLSNGLFEEADINKPLEKIFHTTYDTKHGIITGFDFSEKLYKNYLFDPVLLAWQIDPLFRKYPEMSPYATFMNNPVYYIDPDGADVIGGDDFMKKNSNTTAFKIFMQSQTALTFVKQFASSNGNLYTSADAGKLSRHNLKFSTNTGSEKDYGLTRLMIVGSDGKTTEYKAGMEVSENTQFEINIGVFLGMGNSKGDAGYSAGVINHEAFIHAENYANLLGEWENRAKNGMTIEQFKARLNALQSSDAANKEHDAMTKGNVKNFITTFKEINSYFKSVINSKTVTKEEAKQASINQKMFNECSIEDCPTIESK